MKILQTSLFTNRLKKLRSNQKKDLDKAIKALVTNPTIGEPKKGDLIGISVYKFRVVNQLTLLAYTYEERLDTITLLVFGTHENFYRDLKIN